MTRALYRMKLSARDFRNPLRDCMDHMGYKSCLADPGLWMRISRLDSGTNYIEYVLLYVDGRISFEARFGWYSY